MFVAGREKGRRVYETGATRVLVWLALSSVLLSLTVTVSTRAQTNPMQLSSGLASVPSAPATNGVVQLRLRDAIGMALRYNLGEIETEESSRAARGKRLQALSPLLPRVSVGASESVDQLSTSTLGLRPPVFPTVIGPFSYSTAQATLDQTLFSLESIQRFRAARTAEQSARLSYNNTLDVITLIVGNAYLQVIAAASRIDAAEAEVQNAQAVYDQAAEELSAGTSPKIDVTRSAVQLHTEQYRLSVARNDFAIAKLNLARGIGLPSGQAFEIADRLPYADLEPPDIEQALKTAFSSRSDFRAALDQVKSAQQELSAVRGERYPVLAASGAYGVQGQTFDHAHGIFGFQAGINFPVFTGGRIKGDLTTAEAALRQRRAEAENLRGQIDYDVRTAYLNLQATKEEVAVARQNVDLANENLARSRERFAAGVTDSVEVVQSQQSLSSANDQYIGSLYSHNLAKLELARALGVARAGYHQYLAGR
jgi:outer membrane protein TolC